MSILFCSSGHTSVPYFCIFKNKISVRTTWMTIRKKFPTPFEESVVVNEFCIVTLLYYFVCLQHRKYMAWVFEFELGLLYCMSCWYFFGEVYLECIVRKCIWCFFLISVQSCLKINFSFENLDDPFFNHFMSMRTNFDN